MTDTERNRIEAICKVARVKNIEDLSDGFHTFKQLYFQRMMLFATIVKQNKDKAWKSFRHEDGELCFGGGWFIVGVDTPEGSYTYHYEAKYFDLFDCDILDYGKHWDGHTEKDVTRLLSLTSTEPRKKGKWDFMGWQMFQCSECKHVFTQDFLEGWKEYTYESHFPPFCPNCGADMREGEEE